MRKNPRRILSPQRLPFRHPGIGRRTKVTCQQSEGKRSETSDQLSGIQASEAHFHSGARDSGFMCVEYNCNLEEAKSRSLRSGEAHGAHNPRLRLLRKTTPRGSLRLL